MAGGRVAVLGGSGALGRLVWPQLLEDGRAVALLARGGEQQAAEALRQSQRQRQRERVCQQHAYGDGGGQPPGLTVVTGDALSPAALAQDYKAMKKKYVCVCV
eukprot:COSAG03_NODE_3779_length_1832_cov_1.622620_4_plen_102_part_01